VVGDFIFVVDEVVGLKLITKIFVVCLSCKVGCVMMQSEFEGKVERFIYGIPGGWGGWSHMTTGPTMLASFGIPNN
jgi:hypothetical protein